MALIIHSLNTYYIKGKKFMCKAFTEKSSTLKLLNNQSEFLKSRYTEH